MCAIILRAGTSDYFSMNLFEHGLSGGEEFGFGDVADDFCFAD
jgi:hypothetical protein